MTELPRPVVAPAAPWSFPEPATHTLRNGLRALIYRLPGQHVISTRIVVPISLAAEPTDREGVATMVSRTMDEGTASHSAEEMAELFERNGIALGGGMSSRGLSFEIDSTARNAKLGWELARECLSEPAFEAGEVGRHVKQRLAEIEHEAASAPNRAAKEWQRAFYAESSRASRPVAGSAETVAVITPADVREFHAAHVRPTGATVVVAGDVELDTAIADLEATLGQWEAPKPASTTAERDEVRAGPTRIVFVDRPGSVQTQIHWGSLGPSRREEGGWSPYPVLSFIIGGSPNSLLDTVLREDKGFTYGMHGGFRPRQQDGQFVVSGSVRADVTAEAVELIFQILDGAQFTKEQLQSAVDFVGKTAPGRYATADVVADEAAGLSLDGFGTDFVTSYLANLPELTTDSLQQAWARWSDQPRTIVLVGDAMEYADKVRDLGRGEVTVVS